MTSDIPATTVAVFPDADATLRCSGPRLRTTITFSLHTKLMHVMLIRFLEKQSVSKQTACLLPGYIQQHDTASPESRVGHRLGTQQAETDVIERLESGPPCVSSLKPPTSFCTTISSSWILVVDGATSVVIFVVRGRAHRSMLGA